MTDLDRSNISNAYVSGEYTDPQFDATSLEYITGMKEELNMQGTQFNVGHVPGWFIFYYSL